VGVPARAVHARVAALAHVPCTCHAHEHARACTREPHASAHAATATHQRGGHDAKQRAQRDDVARPVKADIRKGGCKGRAQVQRPQRHHHHERRGHEHVAHRHDAQRAQDAEGQVPAGLLDLRTCVFVSVCVHGWTGGWGDGGEHQCAGACARAPPHSVAGAGVRRGAQRGSAQQLVQRRVWLEALMRCMACSAEDVRAYLLKPALCWRPSLAPDTAPPPQIPRHARTHAPPLQSTPQRQSR
jgi:hypothetical protein